MEKGEINPAMDSLMYVYNEIYSKAEYRKKQDISSTNFNPAFEAGILYAFSEALEAIRIYVEANNINIAEYLESLDKMPYSVLGYKPKGWPEEKPLFDNNVSK